MIEIPEHYHLHALSCFVFLTSQQNTSSTVLEVAPHIGPRPFTATYGRHGDMLLSLNERVVGLSPKNADNGFVEYVFQFFQSNFSTITVI